MVRRVCDPDHVKLDRLEPRTINAPRPQRLVRLDSPFHQGKGQRPMQNPLGAAQTAQWSWILQTVWGWVWGGLSWILDWQAYVFQFVLSGSSFWGAVGRFLFLFFPAVVLVAGVWGTMVSLFTIPFRSGRGRFFAALLMSWWDAVRMAWVFLFGLARFLLVFVGWVWGLLRLGVGVFLRGPEEPGHVALRHAGFEFAPAGGALDRLHAAAVLVRHRGHHLHVHAASDDERAALGLDGLPGEPAGPRRAPVVLPVHHHRGQLRLHPGAERGDQDSRHRADRLDGAGRAGGRPVRGALLVPRADRCHHAVAGPAGVPAGHRRDPGAGPAGVGGRARPDMGPVRPVRHARAARHPRPEGDGRRGRRAGGRERGRGVLARADQRAQGRARVVQEGGPAPHGAADLAGAAAGSQRVQLLGRRHHGQAALQSAVPVAGSGTPQHADLSDRQDPHGRGRCVMRRGVAALALSVVACSPSQRAETPRSTLVIGLDISGSFRRNPSFNGAIEFASLYIYGHLNGVGGLQPNTAIFVGELGGERPGQAKVFHPIPDLSGKTPAQIAADLRPWFPQEAPITDFNAFFQRAALHVKRNNLVLAPLNVVLFSDGEPD